MGSWRRRGKGESLGADTSLAAPHASWSRHLFCRLHGGGLHNKRRGVGVGSTQDRPCVLFCTGSMSILGEQEIHVTQRAEAQPCRLSPKSTQPILSSLPLGPVLATWEVSQLPATCSQARVEVSPGWTGPGGDPVRLKPSILAVRALHPASLQLPPSWWP